MLVWVGVGAKGGCLCDGWLVNYEGGVASFEWSLVPTFRNY